MVMVINPPASGNTLAAYRAAAASRNETAVSPSSGPAGGNLTSGTPSSGSPTGSATGSARPSSTGGAMRFAVDAGSVGGLAVAVAALMW